MAEDPDIVDLFDEGASERRSIEVEERVIEEGSSLAGRTVADAPGSVLAIRRVDGSVEAAPGPDTTLEGGDVVLVLPA
jgi:K+/H+ antiporter YhaU regulatory subunit KhtT